MSNIERNGSGCVDPTVDCIIKKECACKKKANEDYKYVKMKEESGRKRRIY